MHGSDTRELYYSGDSVVAEWYDGLVQAYNVWSPVAANTLVERSQASQDNGVVNVRLYVQQDANGNVTALVNVNDTVLERYAYDPYGVVTVLNANFTGRGSTLYSAPYGFQGMRTDWLTSEDFADNRVYNPALQRWLQTDPIGLIAGNNDYEFVNDSPTNGIDPTGLATNPEAAREAALERMMIKLYQIQEQIDTMRPEILKLIEKNKNITDYRKVDPALLDLLVKFDKLYKLQSKIRQEHDYLAHGVVTQYVPPPRDKMYEMFGPGGIAEQLLMALGGFAGGVPPGCQELPEIQTQ